MREPGHNSLECRSEENLHLAVLSDLVLGARAKETVVTLTGLPPPMSVGRAQCCPYYLVEPLGIGLIIYNFYWTQV